MLQTQAGSQTLRVAADTDARAVAGARLVLFCVKSTDTESAGRQMAPHLAPDALVLCLQNGVDNAERLRAVLPRQAVHPAVVYVGTGMVGPGHVRHHGRGELVIGPDAASDDVLAAFRQAQVPVEVSDNVAGALWDKLVLNCAYNALSAIARLPYGRLAHGDGVAAVMRDVVAECAGVAQACGIVLSDDILQTVLRLADSMPNQRSSTAQDLMRGRPSEIDHINGHVVRRGEALGVPTPVNRLLHVLVKLLEANPAVPSPESAG